MNVEEERSRKIKRLTDDIFSQQIEQGKCREELNDPHLSKPIRDDLNNRIITAGKKIEQYTARRAVLRGAAS